MSDPRLEAHLNFKVQKDGSIPEETVCPWCLQPKESYQFFIASRMTTTKCSTCRRRAGILRA